MTTTPLYLDFDGVLNTMTHDLPRAERVTGYGRWERLESKALDSTLCPYRFRVSRDRNAAVATLAADIVWVTTWWESPSDAVRATGIDADFLHPPLPAPSRYSDSWKAEVIAARHSPDDRFVWIDDASIPAGFARAFPNALLLRPSVRFGLTSAEVATAAAYLTET